MRYCDITCKSALSKSSLPGLDYSLNPYVGCEHACVYCYAPSTLHYNGLEHWGTFVQARTNIPVVLEREVRRLKPGVTGISTVTDPYQPLEKKLRLTRSCLEVLLAKGFPICIQTKSALVLRDMDLISEFRLKDVGFTITTLDDRLSELIEPGASLPRERLAAMKKLSGEGISTWAFIGPVIPGILTEEHLAELIVQVKDSGATRILFDRLRLKPGTRENVEKSLQVIQGVTGVACPAISGDSTDYELLKQKIIRLCTEHQIPCEPGL